MPIRFLLIPLMCALAGCKSVKSTLLERDIQTNNVVTKELDGYPITLKVPTHIRVTLYENTFVREIKDGVKQSGWKIVEIDGDKLRTVSFSTQLIETERIYTVDHKRPAAGQIKYGVNFTDDQYISQMSSAAVEDTIRQSSIAMSRILSLFQGANVAPRTAADTTRTLADGTFTSILASTKKTTTRPVPEEQSIGTDGTDADSKLKTISSVLATGLFEVDDPEFELKLACFLEKATGHHSR